MQKYTGDFFIYYRIGTLLAQLGQWEEAKTCLDNVSKLKHDCPEVDHNLGWVLLNLKTTDGQVQNSREILSTYRRAVDFMMIYPDISRNQWRNKIPIEL